MDPDIFSRSENLLELDGINLLTLRIVKKDTLEVEIEDRNYLDVAQMVGRATRILSKTVPVQVQVFKLKLIDFQSSFKVTEVVIMRNALLRNELAFDGPEKLGQRLLSKSLPPSVKIVVCR